MSNLPITLKNEYGNNNTFRDLYNKMLSWETGVALSQQLTDEISIRFMCLKGEDMFLIQTLPKFHHMGSVHFHPELNTAHAYFGGDGMTLFDGMKVYDLDGEEAVQNFLNHIKILLGISVKLEEGEQ